MKIKNSHEQKNCVAYSFSETKFLLADAKRRIYSISETKFLLANAERRIHSVSETKFLLAAYKIFCSLVTKFSPVSN